MTQFAFRHDQPEALETEAERELRKRGFDPSEVAAPPKPHETKPAKRSIEIGLASPSLPWYAARMDTRLIAAFVLYWLSGLFMGIGLTYAMTGG